MKGFTLIELMIVLAIIALLTMIAMPNFMNYLARAQRTEAYITLKSLYLAEKAYMADHNGKATKNLTGPDSLGWRPTGELKYTYGFPGTQGTNNFIGSLKTSPDSLKGAFVNGSNFAITAAGDIDNDGVPDILLIDQDGKITLVNDDLI